MNRGVDFTVFTIPGTENKMVLEERLKLQGEKVVLDLSYNDFLREQQHLKERSEDAYMDIFPEMGRGGLISNNTGAIGLSYICRKASASGHRVLFSGQGADEIISDYGSKGEKFAPHSAFGGNFPHDLKTVFPWRNFFGGVQRAYLDKEEVVAGSWGIETRYPFLDVDVVQEFLWLSSERKNCVYKAPLQAFLTENGYPYEPGVKIGFTPDSFVLKDKLSPKSLLYRAYFKLLDLRTRKDV
jgi:asparagine synthetase B (glutamine-hydrolysing)